MSERLTAKEKAESRNASIKRLRKLIAPGSIIYYARHGFTRSASGCRAKVSYHLIVTEDGYDGKTYPALRDITGDVGRITYARQCVGEDAVISQEGPEIDVHYLAYALWGKDYQGTGERVGRYATDAAGRQLTAERI